MRVRSLLYAPANRRDLLAKFPRYEADILALDLEDGTPPAERPQARSGLAESVRIARGDRGARVFVRVNPAGTADFGPDLEAVRGSGADGLIVAKTAGAEDLRGLATELPVIAGIESIIGVLHAVEIASAPGVCAVYFGAEDFAAEMGGARTRGGLEVLYARSRVVLAAKAAGVRAIDQVVLDFRDDEFFLEDARAARELGYDGKMCIHPRQLAIANEVFSPSANEVRQARRLVVLYEAAMARGQATIDVDGRMVDGPLYRIALATLVAAGEADRG